MLQLVQYVKVSFAKDIFIGAFSATSQTGHSFPNQKNNFKILRRLKWYAFSKGCVLFKPSSCLSKTLATYSVLMFSFTLDES